MLIRLPFSSKAHRRRRSILPSCLPGQNSFADPLRRNGETGAGLRTSADSRAVQSSSKLKRVNCRISRVHAGLPQGY